MDWGALFLTVVWAYFACRQSKGSFSDSGVPCYLHPSGDECHYRVKPGSPTCTSAEERRRLTDGLRELNRTFTLLETKLIRLGIIPPDNACSELPPLENGGVVYSDLNLSLGSEGHYICNEGYIIHTLYGRKEFKCTEEGVWDGDVLNVPVNCILAVNQCDPPVEVENGNITFRDSDPANILPGDMIEYVCDDGTELNGSHYRYCQRNGNWSDEEPQCIVFSNKQESNTENLGMILGVSLGAPSAVVSVIILTIVVVVSLKWGWPAYKRWKDGRQLMIYDNDPSLNIGKDDSGRYLFDSKSPSLVKEEVDHTVTSKVAVKSQGKASKQNSKTNDSSNKELEESNV